MNAPNPPSFPAGGQPVAPEWLFGGGEMGDRIRSMDWSATPLGARETWPQSLRSVVNVIMASGFPMAILWGSELVFIYNDGYRVIAGDRHPGAMGRSTREVWPEAWEFNKPIFEKVMMRGETVHLDDQLFPVYRNGHIEDAHFTLSCSPIRTETSLIAGTLVVLLETTERISAVRQLKKANERLEGQLAAQKGVEEALRESQERLEMATSATQVGMFDWNLASGSVRWTRTHDAIFGYAPGTAATATEYDYRRWADRVHPEDLPRVEEEMRRRQHDRKPLVVRYRIIWPDGSLHWVETKGAFRYAEDGKAERMLGVVMDITERRLSEEASEKMRNILSESQKIAHLGAFEYVVDTKTTVWSEEEYRIYGLDPAGPSPAYDVMLAESIHPDDAALLHQTFAAAMQDRSTYELEHRIVRPDGSVRWVHDRAIPYFDPDGTLVRYVGATLDITDRKRAEEALKRSTEQIDLLINNLPGYVFFKDADLRYLMVNKRASQLLGRPLEDIVGKNDHELFPAVDAERYSRDDRLVLESGEPLLVQNEAIEEDGQRVIISTRKVPVKDGSGKVTGLIALSIDVTERTRAEMALRESERIYRAIGESIDYGIWICDAQGRNTYASESFLRLLGITQEQCSGFGWGDVLHPDDTEATIAAWKECVQRGGPWYREHRYRGADGRWHPVLACGVAVRNERGEVTAWAGINLDISRLKQTEESLRTTVAELARSNKELEQFAYIASHDLQEPLRQVLSFGNLLEQRYADAFDDKGRQYMAYMIEGSKRMSAIVRDLLDYSRVGRGDDKVEPVAADQVLDAVLANFRVAIEESAASIVRGELPNVMAERVQLGLIFQNLIGNALKFRREGVRPEIRVGCRADGQMCTFWVKDNGIGIPSDLHEKAFVIFQRLHGLGSYPGTGIGLAICKKIVEHHGGRIWTESAVGEGSTFFFTLPLAKEAGA